MTGLSAQRAASLSAQAHQAQLEADALLKEEQQAYARAYNSLPVLWQVSQMLCCPMIVSSPTQYAHHKHTLLQSEKAVLPCSAAILLL